MEKPNLKVSVGMPVRNEQHTVAPLLLSLLAQTRQPDEILVVDGGSSDETVRVAQAIQDARVTVIEVGPAYPGRGRNKAMEAARNDWVALIDGGCTADPGWLEALLAEAGSAGAQAVFGHYEPVQGSEWEVAQALSVVAPVDPSRGCRPPFAGSLLLHRSVWRALGGFPEHLRAAEDLVFFQMLEQSGVRTASTREAIVRWQLPDGPMSAFRRFRLYSASHVSAGLFRTWHARVFLMDVALLALVVGSMFWLPALALALAAGAVRVAWTIHRRRMGVRGNPFRLGRVWRVALLLALADAAAWLGWFDHLAKRRPRP